MNGPHNPLLTFAKLAAASTCVALVFAGLSFGPASMIGGPDGAAAMGFATLAALIGSFAAAVPPAYTFHGSAQSFAYAALFGLGIRFLVTISVAMGIRALTPSLGGSLLVWTGVSQMVLLAADVYVLVRLSRARRAHAA